jgi:predicted GNAT family acetyltransferase
VLKPIDDTPVWSIVCFFVAKSHRGRGLTLDLIRAAVDYAKRAGGTVVEAYPSVPKSGKASPLTSFMGFPSVFKQAGFSECARPSKSKVVMRLGLEVS